MFDNIFDPGSFVLGGVTLIAMVFGLTQFFKEQFNLEGNAVRWLAFGIGAGVMVFYKLVGIIPEPYGQIVEIIFNALAFALTAAGFYQYNEARQTKG